MAQICTRLTGAEDIRFLKGRTGAALAIGDPVSIDDDTFDVIAAVTGKFIAGIAKDALGAASTAVIRYDALHPGDIVRIKIAAGTGGAISEKGQYVDLVGVTGVTLTESSKDCFVVGWNGDAAYLDVQFMNLMQTFGPTLATTAD